jgi:hypothetical protein
MRYKEFQWFGPGTFLALHSIMPKQKLAKDLRYLDRVFLLGNAVTVVGITPISPKEIMVTYQENPSWHARRTILRPDDLLDYP